MSKFKPPRMDTDDSSSVFSSYSAVSTTSLTSAYRHHQAGGFMPTRTEAPRPVLVKDAQHIPATSGSFGIMIVGLGGANGTVLLAGILANRLKVEWHGPRGEPMSPNYYGCITQLDQKGGGVGYRNKVKGLADASMAAVGGWDIRPDKPGDALLRDQILDYDLVRQIKDDMNKVKIFRGVYDPRFIGSSQHETALHILTAEEAPTDSEALKCLRADIRYFKWRNGVVGHTTVIWSASVEPNCELVSKLQTSGELLASIEMSENDRGGPLPPSLLYATAALLEGCSFVNGGSQNTLSCPGLNDLAKQQCGVYCLGTDYKAGQTKFKTAAVEYIRTMGLLPKVIASSNHLGNNDMKNLSNSEATSTAKLRVKHDIFAPWLEDQLDHKVSIMYTPFINDEKRDFVEYTSLGFLGQIHTMVTYTRASDSVLCVPLMIDGAVWCDYFSALSWPFDKVAKALAYLFKCPEGEAAGVDPGFFAQMKELDNQVMAAHEARNGFKSENSVKKRVRIRPGEKSAEWAIPYDARIICAGLACVDMQLNNATGGGGESIESFEGEQSIGGGSVAMAVKTLARLCYGAPLDECYMEITPPVVHSIVPLCKIGFDGTGDTLIRLLEECGEACRNVDTKYIKAARNQDPGARTALAVLPIYKDGRRGCFFDSASNGTFCAQQMVEMIANLSSGASGPVLNTSTMSPAELEVYQADLEEMTPIYGAFLFGYPHLLPKMQGESLAQILLEARSSMVEGGIIAMDMNGVPEAVFPKESGLRSVSDLNRDRVIGAALQHVDILHLNEDELCLLTGCEIMGTTELTREDEAAIANAVSLFLNCGVAIVVLTLGIKGSLVCCNGIERFRRTRKLPVSWAARSCRVGCVQLPKDAVINGNGAGDSFTAGFLVATMLRHTGTTATEPPANTNTSSTHENSSLKGADSLEPMLTPYSLYMRENYVSLKKQLSDNKKEIFTRCHEKWEQESDEVKTLYERRALEANEKSSRIKISSVVHGTRKPSLGVDTSSQGGLSQTIPVSPHVMTRSLSLESAVKFASLLAAYHIDVSTRDRKHIDVNQLIDRAMIVSDRWEEI